MQLCNIFKAEVAGEHTANHCDVATVVTAVAANGAWCFLLLPSIEDEIKL